MTDQPDFSDEDPFIAVQRLMREFDANPDDHDIRCQVATGLKLVAERSISLTVHQVRVITTVKQRQLCHDIANLILGLGVIDPQLTAFATELLNDVREGDQWDWESRTLAYTLVTGIAIAGVAAVAVGATSGNIPVVVVSALLSSALIALVILRYRKEKWRISARQVLPLLSHHGI